MGKSAAPMSDALTAVFGKGALSTTLIVLAVAGLLTTIHGSIYGLWARDLRALACGYFPRILSITANVKHRGSRCLPGRGRPRLRLFDRQLWRDQQARPALLNMAVFGAVISYRS